MNYKTSGVCASNIEVVVSNDIIEDVKFVGGCDGNLKGIVNLVKGMKVDEVIEKLQGISCKTKSTSCPDQLANALRQLNSN